MNLTLPVGSGMPLNTPSIGTMRFNSQRFEVEYWNGSGWVTAASIMEPKTVWEWLQKYAGHADFVQDGTQNRRLYINHKMQGKFPGAYSIEYNNILDEWEFSFATPEAETLFWLKYS